MELRLCGLVPSIGQSCSNDMEIVTQTSNERPKPKRPFALLRLEGKPKLCLNQKGREGKQQVPKRLQD